MKVLSYGATLWVGILAAGAAARDKVPVLEAVSQCRAVAEASERLRCFDTASAALDDAIARNNLYALDKTQVQKTRRTLFGLPLPDLGLFDEADRDAATVKQIDATLTFATHGNDGNWIFGLDTNAVWRQTDEVEFGRSPNRGDKVTVKRAALGSHVLTDGRTAVRVVRVR